MRNCVLLVSTIIFLSIRISHSATLSNLALDDLIAAENLHILEVTSAFLLPSADSARQDSCGILYTFEVKKTLNGEITTRTVRVVSDAKLKMLGHYLAPLVTLQDELFRRQGAELTSSSSIKRCRKTYDEHNVNFVMWLGLELVSFNDDFTDGLVLVDRPMFFPKDMKIISTRIMPVNSTEQEQEEAITIQSTFRLKDFIERGSF